MISTHPELVIWAALVVLYLSDLATLLHFNEMFLEHSPDGFAARVNASRMEFRNRRLAWLNPLTPHLPLYRIRWGTRSWEEADAETDQDRIRSGCEALRLPGRLCLLLAVTLFAAFPALSVTAGFETAFLFGAVAGYGLLFAAIAIVVARMRRLGVDTEKLLPLLVVSCLCLPCGVNLCRRASLLVEVDSDAAKLLPHLLTGPHCARALEAIVTCAREEIELGLEDAMEERLRKYIASVIPR